MMRHESRRRASSGRVRVRRYRGAMVLTLWILAVSLLGAAPPAQAYVACTTFTGTCWEYRWCYEYDDQTHELVRLRSFTQIYIC